MSQFDNPRDQAEEQGHDDDVAASDQPVGGDSGSGEGANEGFEGSSSPGTRADTGDDASGSSDDAGFDPESGSTSDMDPERSESDG